LKYAG
jgi:hypothetical protein